MLRHILVGICAAAAMTAGVATTALAEDVTYLLPAPLSLPAFGPFVIAKQRGYFKAEGLNVTFQVGKGGVDVAKQVGAGNAVIGGGIGDTSIIVRPNGVPVKAVAVLGGGALMQLVLDKDKGLTTVKDLKGKTVAAQLGAGASYFWLNYVLAQNGLKLSDIQAVDMKAGDAGAAFVAGKIDAAVTWEPWLSRAKDTPFGQILIASDKTPGIIVDSLGFKPDFLKRRGDDVKKIIAAWNEAVQFAAQSPKEADAIMAKFTNQKPEEFTAEKSGVRFYGEKENKEYFGTPQKPGRLYEVTQRAADTWLELKFIKSKPNAADLIDGSYF